jgi:hypothetical protein
MKKLMLCLSLLILSSLACDVSISVPQPENTATQTVVMIEPATPTPEIFIALTQAVPGDHKPTDTPNSTTTPPPTVRANTQVIFYPLSLVIPGSVADGASGLELPRLDSEDAAWWQKTPGHLEVSLGDYYTLKGKTHLPAVYVYPAQAYAELVPAAFESIHRLNNYLYNPDNVSTLDQLPIVPFFNAQVLFRAHILPVAFQNGKGVRFVTEYAQYPAAVNNQDVFYQFVGVTNDGYYYVVAIFPITSPILADTSDAEAPLPENGVPYPFLADPDANMNDYYIAITDLLNVQAPDRFTPNLNDLDTLIQSMRIEP